MVYAVFVHFEHILQFQSYPVFTGVSVYGYVYTLYVYAGPPVFHVFNTASSPSVITLVMPLEISSGLFCSEHRSSSRGLPALAMKLKILPSQGSKHAALTSAVSWASGCLASGGDDQYVQRWTSAGQTSGQVSTPLSVGTSICMLS